jgi:hypothetical protein
MTQVRSVVRACACALVISLLAASPALAGPLLLCHPFATSGSVSLPWGTAPSWNSPDPGYDTGRLTEDVLKALDDTTSVLTHMETLRRATIYATRDARLSAGLLAAVRARADERRASSSGPLAVFDAGYLVETYRQAVQVYRWDMLSGAAKAAWAIREAPAGDGYALMREALRRAPDPEMELAASLIAPGAAADEHRRRAAAGAQPGSPLARTLAALAAER